MFGSVERKGLLFNKARAVNLRCLRRYGASLFGWLPGTELLQPGK